MRGSGHGVFEVKAMSDIANGFDHRCIVSEKAALDEADARLIAAAPDLLEALMPFAAVAEALDFYVEEAMPSEESLCFPRGDVRVHDGECQHKQLSFNDFRRARAAIAKAKGESE